MLPISDMGLGGNLCFPDVCLTPPLGAPIPYPNLSQNCMSGPSALKTFVSCKNAQHIGSIAPMTMGDNSGVMSPFMGMGMNTLGSLKVFLEGLPAVHLGCPAMGNNGIAPIGLKAIPSINNVLVTHAGAPRPGPVSAEQMAGLARALRGSREEEVEATIGSALYLRVPVFSLGLPSRVHAALQRAGEASALILDLRGCPGGELTAAVELAGDFLDEGATIATVVDEDGDEVVYRAQQERPNRIPLALLVDHGTASAAEIFAGALKAHGRAAVIGARTYGKGTAQQLLPGANGPGAHYATVATIRLPDDEPLHGRGVTPDVEIDDSTSSADDPALSIALALLDR